MLTNIECVCRGMNISNPGQRSKKTYFLTEDDEGEYMANMEINDWMTTLKRANSKWKAYKRSWTLDPHNLLQAEKISWNISKGWSGRKWYLKTCFGEVINPLGRIQVSGVKEVRINAISACCLRRWPTITRTAMDEYLIWQTMAWKVVSKSLWITFCQWIMLNHILYTILRKYKLVFSEDLGTRKGQFFTEIRCET
jgi:hypothetical protein